MHTKTVNWMILFSVLLKVFDNCGDSLNEGNYCSLWLQHKLVIGPTNMGSITQQQMQQLRSNIYLKYYGGHEDNVI